MKRLLTILILTGLAATGLASQAVALSPGQNALPDAGRSDCGNAARLAPASPAHDDGRLALAACSCDVSMTRIISPTGSIARCQYQTITVRVANHGADPASFPVRAKLIDPCGRTATYSSSVADLAPGATADVQFVTRRHDLSGMWRIVAYTRLADDENRANDTVCGSFRVDATAGWQTIAPIPAGPHRPDKGGALAVDSTGNFYLLKGRNSPQIYRFGTELDDAQVAGAIPQDQTRISSGTRIAALAGRVYVLKASRCLEFGSLDVATGRWNWLASLPAGPDNKPAGKGAALTVASGSIYALKGNRTSELYRYDLAEGRWAALAPLPVPARSVGDGAALAADGLRLYATVGNCNSGFFCYDIATGSWHRLADLPGAVFKSGAGLACVNGTIYATAGGNKPGFFAYDPATDNWTALDDVPLGPDSKKVSHGGALAVLDGLVLLLKGESSTHLLAYDPAAQPACSRPRDAGSTIDAGAESTARSQGIVRAALTVNAAGRVRLYSSAGALVRQSAATGRTEIDTRDLPGGTYLLRAGTDDGIRTTRLVIAR